MDKNEKILTAKHQMAGAIGAAPDVFDQRENVFSAIIICFLACNLWS